jgi:hypothetical protein
MYTEAINAPIGLKPLFELLRGYCIERTDIPPQMQGDIDALKLYLTSVDVDLELLNKFADNIFRPLPSARQIESIVDMANEIRGGIRYTSIPFNLDMTEINKHASIYSAWCMGQKKISELR